MDAIEQIAVFVDVENLIGFCNELQMPINLADVLEKLRDEGRIVVRRSFGDISKSLSATDQSRAVDNVRRMLRDNLFFHEDIPYKNAFKNSADMRLAVEALHTAFTFPSISKFAVISGDSDYVPLFLKLKEQNKTVIGITGSERHTADIYRRACDSLLYFSDLTPTIDTIVNASELSSETIEKNAEADVKDEQLRSEQKSLKDDYASLLVRAVQAASQSGRQTDLRGLQTQMRQLRADFNPERAGFVSFNDLVEYASEGNLVVIAQNGNDVAISLPGILPQNATEQKVSTAQYRMYLQDRLKCQLPSYELRAAICEQAYNQIKFSEEDGGILLSDLSNDVTDELANQKVNVPQQSVFKYLLSLYQARCFAFEQTDRRYDPRITDFRAQKDEWDEHFVGSQIKLLADDAGYQMYPAKLSQLFYETEGETMKIKNLLNSLTIKYEQN